MSDVQQAFNEGAHRVALAVAGFLPSVLTMLLITAFGVGLACLVRFALRRLLTGIDYDRRVHRWGLTATSEWTPKDSPTVLTAQSAFWFVVLVGFLAGLKALNTTVTDTVAGAALAYVPNLLAAGIVLVVGMAVARFLERTAPISAVNMQIHGARFVSMGVKWLVILFVMALTLQQLRIGGTVLTISFAAVFGGIVLALALAIGIGSRKAVSRGWEQRWREERRAEEETKNEIHHM
jgi:hypothetical protein